MSIVSFFRKNDLFFLFLLMILWPQLFADSVTNLFKLLYFTGKRYNKIVVKKPWKSSKKSFFHFYTLLKIEINQFTHPFRRVTQMKKMFYEKDLFWANGTSPRIQKMHVWKSFGGRKFGLKSNLKVIRIPPSYTYRDSIQNVRIETQKMDNLTSCWVFHILYQFEKQK